MFRTNCKTRISCESRNFYMLEFLDRTLKMLLVQGHWVIFGLKIWNIQKEEYYLFYHGYCKEQWNAAVIVLQYTLLRRFWDVMWNTSLFLTQCDTMWRNSCILSSIYIQNHVNYMQIWRVDCGIDLLYLYWHLDEALPFQDHLPLLKHIIDKNRLWTIIIAFTIK